MISLSTKGRQVKAAMLGILGELNVKLNRAKR